MTTSLRLEYTHVSRFGWQKVYDDEDPDRFYFWNPHTDTSDWAHPDYLEPLLSMTNHMMSARDSFIMYKLCTSINLFVLLALFFKFARHQERLAIVNKTFKYALPDLMHFFIILGVIVVFFVASARVIFVRTAA